MSRAEKALTGGGVFILQMGIRMITPFIVSPLLVRNTGAEALGAYAVIVQLSAYVLMLDLGMGQALSRFIAQSDVTRDSEKVSDYIVGSVFFLTAAGLFAGLIIGILSWTLPYWLEGSPSIISESSNALILMGLWYVFRIPSAIFQTYLFARQFTAITGIASIISDIISCLLQISLTLFGLGILGLVSAIIVSEAFAIGFCAWYVLPEWKRLKWTLKWHRSRVRELFRVGIPLSLISLADRLTFSSQNIIVGFLYDTRIVASFYASRLPGYSAAGILWRVSDPVVPALNELYGKKLYTALEHGFTRIAGYKLGLSIWVSCMVFLFNKPFIETWMGVDFYLGSLMSLAVALFVPISSFNNILRKLVIVQGRLGFYTLIILVEGILSVTLSVLLGRSWGSPGVMIAICITQFVSITYSYLKIGKLFKGSLLKMTFAILHVSFKAAFVGVAVCLIYLVIYPYTKFLPWFIWLSLLTIIALYGFIIFGLTTEDYTSITNLIKKMLHKKSMIFSNDNP
jgi:O-antigen/teichoic acid export membrane protein